MSKVNSTAQKVEIEGNPSVPQLTKTIGGTTYRVNIHFSQTAREKMSDKIVRLIKSEVLAG